MVVEVWLFISDTTKQERENKDLYVFNPELKNFDLIAGNITGLDFCQTGEKLLYFSPSEIWIYFNKEEKELVTRLSQKIDKAIWYGKTNQHIVFLVNNILKITEIDNRNEKNTFDLIENDIKDIGYSPNTKEIYFIEDEHLFKLLLE